MYMQFSDSTQNVLTLSILHTVKCAFPCICGKKKTCENCAHVCICEKCIFFTHLSVPNICPPSRMLCTSSITIIHTYVDSRRRGIGRGIVDDI